MPDTETKRPTRRVLDPQERIAEVLFGLIMALTFTGSLSIAEAGRDDIRTMLIGALGCNLAWGIIDGVFYLMGCLADKGHGLAVLRSVRQAASPVKARQLIAEALPSSLARVLGPDEIAAMHERLLDLPEPPEKARLSGADWRGAVGVLLLVFLSTFPVVLPFLFMQDKVSAMRLSNGIAILMLYLLGWGYGRYISRAPWLLGIGMVVLGGVLVALTIALGG